MKLTPLAKMFVAAVVLTVVGYSGYHYHTKGAGQTPTPSPPSAASKADLGGGAVEAPVGVKPPREKRNPKKIIIGVNDFGGAYAGLVANDGVTPGPGSRFAKAGLDVEIRLIRGSKERLAAFDNGDVDVMLLTLDYYANLVPIYQKKGEPLGAFFMADWSRGNLGIVSKPTIKSIEALRDAKIATTRNTPTHYFLLSLLKKSNLKPDEIEKVKQNIVFATKTPQAGEMFKRGEVDAVAIWEPHLSQAMAGGAGRLLVSTTTATNLIADVLFARRAYLDEHKDEMATLVRVWLEGVKQLEADPKGSVQLIARAFKQSIEETDALLHKIKPATFADNRVFFGLEREQCAYLTLFDDASRFWQKEGVIDSVAPAAPQRWMHALEANAKGHADEKVAEKFVFRAPKPGVDPLLTKSVSIYFASGDATLGPNAKQIVDQFAETLAQFGNAYIKVEGNTDNIGARAANQTLSKKRAQTLVDYLVAKHSLDKQRIQAYGNGPDKPVGDNKTEGGREVNRRTDFAIIPND